MTATLRDDGWLRQSGRAGALLSVLGAVVWLTGLPFLFPSLGPTAYLFATRPAAPASAARRVVGGHAVGVGAGLLAAHAVAGGVAVTASMAPGAPGTLRLAASGVVAVVLTTAGMRATDTGHAPACATTLIVGLGILPSLREGVIILLAVGVLTVEQSLLVWVLGDGE
ncbi:HPP family protein [Halomicroarcula sp. GCM10025817]|uniref:HPP family protein n=1 Tax=Haloarcula TaxID=2237 RepID=UPI0023E8D9FD|nr:HPP family protein [Halomicroarcula sp. SYNS111]